MAATIEQVNMTEGALLPKIVRFSLPLAATGVLQLLFNAADVIVVGKFAGATALAAVGATTSLVALLVNALMSISVGVNILVARYLGCREYDRVRTCVHTVFALSFVLGLIVMVAGLTLSTPLLELMKTPEDVLPLSSLYLRIYFIGVPGTVMYNFGAALLRAFGDTKRPMVFLTVSGVVNACLNLFFVIVCHMSVDGVATATVISQYISLFLVVRCLCRSEGLSHLELKEIRLDKEESIRMIQIGFPAGLQSMLFSISNVLVQSSVNSFGASVVAANTAASNIEGFIYTAMNSVFHAAITFTSQNLGAGKLSRTKRVYGSCIATSLMIGLPMCLVYFLFAPSLLSIYVSSADPSYQDVINYGLIRHALARLLPVPRRTHGGRVRHGARARKIVAPDVCHRDRRVPEPDHLDLYRLPGRPYAGDPLSVVSPELDSDGPDARRLLHSHLPQFGTASGEPPVRRNLIFERKDSYARYRHG